MTDQTTDQAALRDRIAETLTAAAYECDGKCGLSERECYDAHPITFSARCNGTTHVDAPVTAIADAVLAVLPAPADRAALERRLKICERRRDELREESLRRGKTVLEYSERNRALEREIDGVRRQLGAEILCTNQAEVLLRSLADPEPCVWQGDFCSTHRWRSDAGTCPHGQAQVLLAGEPAVGARQDETAAAAHPPRRGDEFEAWLKQQRDDHRDSGRGQWSVLDNLLDRYRLHADTGTPLGQHVCEGQVVGDCECLEQPAAGARQDGAQP